MGDLKGNIDCKNLNIPDKTEQKLECNLVTSSVKRPDPSNLPTSSTSIQSAVFKNEPMETVCAQTQNFLNDSKQLSEESKESLDILNNQVSENCMDSKKNLVISSTDRENTNESSEDDSNDDDDEEEKVENDDLNSCQTNLIQSSPETELGSKRSTRSKTTSQNQNKTKVGDSEAEKVSPKINGKRHLNNENDGEKVKIRKMTEVKDLGHDTNT